jgi:hypothetical protein
MTIIFVGAIIVVVGGVIGAIGTLLHNRSSSMKSSQILTNTTATNSEIAKLREENSRLRLESLEREEKLNSKIVKLLEGNEALKTQMRPFEVLLQKYYPDQDRVEALNLLANEIENLKKSVRDRELTSQQKVNLISELKQYGKRKVTIVSIMGDAEAFKYAHQFKTMFSESGWEVDGINQAIYDAPMPPLSIDATNPPSKIVNDLYGIISKCGINVVGNLKQSLKEDELTIIVGKKP